MAPRKIRLDTYFQDDISLTQNAVQRICSHFPTFFTGD